RARAHQGCRAERQLIVELWYPKAARLAKTFQLETRLGRNGADRVMLNVGKTFFFDTSSN
ncbi:MAG: hypothetical protein UF085_02820, partial [Collinsella sp.]|nr:hypothetical protein [Collinsella sp.]